MCRGCGFIFNQAFDQKLTEYSGRYEETQAFSDTFNSFHVALADRLIEEHQLHGKSVLEIGCGKGEFLKLLCERAGAQGVGFDPGYQAGRLAIPDDLDVSFVKDFYDERYVDQSADFVCCKMTLEHLPAAKSFMDVVRSTIGDDSSDVFFQIPEARRIFETLAFEDIYYEHCNYFTAGSVFALFQRSGFDVQSVNIEYDDQYLTVEARPSPTPPAPGPLADPTVIEELWALVNSYDARVAELLAEWRGAIDKSMLVGNNVVLWGSGSKGVSFLSTIGRDEDIAGVVDINPHRWGHYMCGSGIPIVAPQDLVDIAPDLVIVMNRVYVDEIRAELTGLGLHPEIRALGA